MKSTITSRLFLDGFFSLILILISLTMWEKLLRMLGIDIVVNKARYLINNHEGLYSAKADRLIKIDVSRATALTPVYAYRDPVGIPTIGWGCILYPKGFSLVRNGKAMIVLNTKGEAVKIGDMITKEQADKLRDLEIKQKLESIEAKNKVVLSAGMKAGLTSFAYNVGVSGLTNSTLWKLLQQGKPKTEVAKEFDKWVYAKGKKLPGLVSRREDEKSVFLS